MKSAIKQLFCKVCDVAMQVSSVQQLPGARDGPRPQVAAVTQTLAGANESVWEKGKQTLARLSWYNIDSAVKTCDYSHLPGNYRIIR